MKGKIYLVLAMLTAIMLLPQLALAEDYTCAVYFTGDGCPHCAKAAPVIEKVIRDTPNLVLIKYEVYKKLENAPVLEQYAASYGVQPGIPLLIFNGENILQGDTPIITQMKLRADALESNPCALSDGVSVNYSSLKKDELPGSPEIIFSGKSEDAGTGLSATDLSFVKIVSLAVVDAINPCAFAVLLLLLLTILTNNPNKKHKVLLSGLMFILAIFLIYFIYGLVIIKFFQLVQALASVKYYVYKLFALAAIILGILNIRDFLSYAPGRAGTEMPLMFRPKVRKILTKVASPTGAFTAGAFVALFLLPCTIGPYIIAGGLMAELGFMATFPWLVLYNALFVLPMLAITLIVWGGISRVEDLSDWKDKHIRYIHLIAGIIMAALGIAMFFGWL